MLVAFGLLALGIVFLIVSGDFMVRGAAALARHWGVPSLVVGLTIVAFGTSAPEMVVSVQATLRGMGQLAMGNVVGSNIANVLLALGIPALIMAIPTNMSGVARNSFVCLLATIGLIGLTFLGNPMVLWQGAILFMGIILYLCWMFILAKTGANDPILEEMAEIDEGEGGLPTHVGVSLGWVVVGIIGLVFGGWLIVENAQTIAIGFGVSETIIGLTIIAIGTSLPEIATVVIASYRGHSEVAIGNVLGSNIFNSLAVMGAAAMSGPVLVEKQLFQFDMWVMLASMLILMVFVMSRKPIGRKAGLVLTLGYVAYLAVLYMLQIAG